MFQEGLKGTIKSIATEELFLYHIKQALDSEATVTQLITALVRWSNCNNSNLEIKCSLGLLK